MVLDMGHRKDRKGRSSSWSERMQLSLKLTVMIRISFEPPQKFQIYVQVSFFHSDCRQRDDNLIFSPRYQLTDSRQEHTWADKVLGIMVWEDTVWGSRAQGMAQGKDHNMDPYRNNNPSKQPQLPSQLSMFLAFFSLTLTFSERMRSSIFGSVTHFKRLLSLTTLSQKFSF